MAQAPACRLDIRVETGLRVEVSNLQTRGELRPRHALCTPAPKNTRRSCRGVAAFKYN